MMCATRCWRKPRGGDPHLGKFYRTALGNPALRPLLRRAGLAELTDGQRLGDLREARQARPRRREPGLGGDRPAGRRPARHHRAETSAAGAGAVARARARGRRNRQRDPDLRRASAAILCQQRIHPDLRRLQPDRRPRSQGPRIPDGAERAQLPRLQELDPAVQPRARLHRALARPRPDQSALDRHCRADVAADADPAPFGLLRRVLHRGAARLPRQRPRRAVGGHHRAGRDRGHGRVLPHHQPRGGAGA